MRGVILGIGAGRAGLYRQAFEQAGLELAAVCAGGPRRGAGGVTRQGETAFYPDQAELFSKEERLDFAVVGGAPDARFKSALLALENRAHVICEPPFCASTSEFEDLREAAASRGLTLGVLQPWERSAAWAALEKTVTGGLPGKISWAQAQVLREGPAPAGGETAADGWQAFAMLLAVVRLPPSALSARLTPAPEKGAKKQDASAAFLVHFGGADGAAHVSSGAHAGRVRVSAAGEKGRLDLDGDLLRLDIKGLEPETVRLRDGLCGAADRPELLAAELADFAREIKKELPAGSSLRNARYCVKLLKNAYYSASLRSSAVPL